jgi:flagellin-specific chaperone FliS
MTRSVRAYRSSATEGATHIDILLACYDALAEDIRLAGKSAVAGNVAARCRYSEHALLLIGHLESWIPLLDDSELATNLANFYSYLRTEILRLQLCIESDRFLALALVVGETRATWQKKQNTALSQMGMSESLQTTAEPEGLASRLLVSV